MSDDAERRFTRVPGSAWAPSKAGRWADAIVEVDWVRRNGLEEPECIRVYPNGSSPLWLEWCEDEAGWDAVRVEGSVDTAHAEATLRQLADAYGLLDEARIVYRGKGTRWNEERFIREFERVLEEGKFHDKPHFAQQMGGGMSRTWLYDNCAEYHVDYGASVKVGKLVRTGAKTGL